MWQILVFSKSRGDGRGPKGQRSLLVGTEQKQANTGWRCSVCVQGKAGKTEELEQSWYFSTLQRWSRGSVGRNTAVLLNTDTGKGRYKGPEATDCLVLARCTEDAHGRRTEQARQRKENLEARRR